MQSVQTVAGLMIKNSRVLRLACRVRLGCILEQNIPLITCRIIYSGHGGIIWLLISIYSKPSACVENKCVYSLSCDIETWRRNEMWSGNKLQTAWYAYTRNELVMDFLPFNLASDPFLPQLSRTYMFSRSLNNHNTKSHQEWSSIATDTWWKGYGFESGYYYGYCVLFDRKTIVTLNLNNWRIRRTELNNHFK